MEIAGDLGFSSVPPLKAKPSTPRRFPLMVQSALRTLRRNRSRCSFVDAHNLFQQAKIVATLARDGTVGRQIFGKHEPP